LHLKMAKRTGFQPIPRPLAMIRGDVPLEG
jgi:hypothetical protein